MGVLYFAKQKIYNKNKKVFAHELLFRDSEHGIKNFPTNIKATSNVLINVLINVSDVIEETGTVLVNVDEAFLLSGMIDLLDKKKFMLEILETTDLTDKVIAKIKQYHKRGFKIAIDDFDCTAEMTRKFTPILKYVHLVKIDVILAEYENIKAMVPKLKKLGLKVLAEKIETLEEYTSYVEMGFDLFQGYYLSKPQTVEINRSRDLTEVVILNVIKLLRNDADTHAIEAYIKQRSELCFKLIKFLNVEGAFESEIVSIIQAITLLGRDKLLRWLFLYLHAEMEESPISQIILEISLHRAEIMEANVTSADKDKAYLAGMFSMIGPLFDTTNAEIVKDINLDKEIEDLVVRSKGKFLSGLVKAQVKEQAYLKRLFMEKFDKIDPIDILYTLEANGIEVDTSKM
ncbi:EAL domain-containing protein [Sulfurimonas sp. SAG-AH-194-I05]|nr:EAL domain-containing protein [Sulfurimonas sp. SAG-AH-194-I05]MDF1874646.1 EAL domain-containing protein [Sulfurimonas sp. SAG-AH-194-I05]